MDFHAHVGILQVKPALFTLKGRGSALKEDHCTVVIDEAMQRTEWGPH